MSKNRFPPGWDEKRVKGGISHYESQSEDEDDAVAEDEAEIEVEADEAIKAIADEVLEENTAG